MALPKQALRGLLLVAGLIMVSEGAAQVGSVSPCPLQQYRVPSWSKDHGVIARRLKDDLTVAYQVGDRDLAMAILCAGAAAKVPLAEMALAAMVAEGKLGLKKDPAQARMWLERAARSGDSQAQLALSNMYMSGVGGPIRIGEGMELMRAAARGGNVSAQFLYGAELYLGRYAQRDLKGALFWLRRAAGNGHGKAKETLRQLAKEGIR